MKRILRMFMLVFIVTCNLFNCMAEEPTLETVAFLKDELIPNAEIAREKYFSFLTSNDFNGEFLEMGGLNVYKYLLGLQGKTPRTVYAMVSNISLTGDEMPHPALRDKDYLMTYSITRPYIITSSSFGATCGETVILGGIFGSLENTQYPDVCYVLFEYEDFMPQIICVFVRQEFTVATFTSYVHTRYPEENYSANEIMYRIRTMFGPDNNDNTVFDVYNIKKSQ